MTTSKFTVSMDAGTRRLAEHAARRAGISLSAFLARAARREAVRLGVGPAQTGPDPHAEALADVADHRAAELDQQRRAG